MGEAEDVLLEIGERITAPLRARWTRESHAHDAPELHALASAHLELQVFLIAVFGRSWPIHALPPAQTPARMLRALSARLRLADANAGAPWTDGRALHLGSRASGATHPDDVRRALRCAALGLAARIARGSPSAAPLDPLARDLFWIADARAAETHVTDVLPGLAAELTRCRQRALELRAPAPRGTLLEQRVEALLRDELAASAPSREPASALAQRAIETALRWRSEVKGHAAYRGVAPAFCWARPVRAAAAALVAGIELQLPGSLPTRELRVTAEPCTGERPDEHRGAPLLVPPGDPHASVEPAGRSAPPVDQGDEDLDVLGSELERLQQLTSVRSERAVKEILASSSGPAASSSTAMPASERHARARAYPEWDFRAARYRRGYCLVHSRAAVEGDPDWAASVRAAQRGLLRKLRSSTERLRPRLERRPGEPQGSEIDLERYVAAHAEQRASGVASERLYVDRRRLSRDLAVGLLIDTSASTDRWVAPGRRVIDLAREAALLFCEVASAVGDPHALFAFSGTGPAGVRVAELKSFAERYGGSVARRIAGLEPEAYTRIGGALRRVAEDVARTSARRRLLLLLSDGCPNDADEYESRYGVEDTRRAVAELQLVGVRPFCVAIDPPRSAPLAYMFGHAGHGVLRDLRRLPEHLTAVYRQLARG